MKKMSHEPLSKEIKLNPKSERNIKKGFVSFFCAFFIILGIVLILGYIFAPLKWVDQEVEFSPIASLLFWAAVIWVTYLLYKKSNSLKHVFYRTFVALAIMSFVFPVSILIAGLRFTSAESDPFGMLGAGIGTGIAFIFAAVLGILFGLTFSVSAYFLHKSIKEK